MHEWTGLLVPPLFFYFTRENREYNLAGVTRKAKVEIRRHHS